MVSFDEISDEELIKILKEYNKDCDDSLNDYPSIIERAEINDEWRDVTFTFAYCRIMLDYDTLDFKEGQPLNAITENICPIEEERKVMDEYRNNQVRSLQ